MITQAQAHATAARWLNPEGQQGPPREVALQEFDLGWVVWAVPPPPEADPHTGQRRPPAEVGAACGVVDRASGELTVWPSVPVEEVVRMYRQKHGAGTETAPSAPAERPATGPGNTAVATYNDPSTGEETSLARVSAPVSRPPSTSSTTNCGGWASTPRTSAPSTPICGRPCCPAATPATSSSAPSRTPPSPAPRATACVPRSAPRASPGCCGTSR